jgi:hypothetical protein
VLQARCYRYGGVVVTRVLTLVVVGLFAATVAASAETGASRIVDRTLLCATSLSGGVYEIEASSYAGTREGRSKWARLPFAVATTGDEASATEVLKNSLVWISAGRPHAETQLGDYRDVGGAPVPTAFYGTLAVSRRCRTISTRIQLTSVGLTGGRVGQLGESFACGVPRRVLVRVRAVFESPTTLKGIDITTGSDPYLLTSTPVREARLAVRTQSGKPLVYATVAASGRSTLHTGKGCFAS